MRQDLIDSAQDRIGARIDREAIKMVLTSAYSEEELSDEIKHRDMKLIEFLEDRAREFGVGLEDFLRLNIKED